jgi:hypothetical protein
MSFLFLNAEFSENRSKQLKFIWEKFLNLSKGGMGMLPEGIRYLRRRPRRAERLFTK